MRLLLRKQGFAVRFRIVPAYKDLACVGRGKPERPQLINLYLGYSTVVNVDRAESEWTGKEELKIRKS